MRCSILFGLPKGSKHKKKFKANIWLQSREFFKEFLKLQILFPIRFADGSAVAFIAENRVSVDAKSTV